MSNFLDLRQLSLNEIMMAAQNSHGSQSSNQGMRDNSNSGSNSLTMSMSMMSENKEIIKISVVETERVINQEAVNEDIKCRICHGILMRPLECMSCENCFCLTCLQKWVQEAGSCPFKCKGELEFKTKPHKVIRNMLSQLKLTCKNKNDGCNQIINYDKLELHEEVDCEF